MVTELTLVVIREVRWNDSNALLGIRNAPENRIRMNNPEVVGRKSHDLWFEHRLKARPLEFWVAAVSEQPVAYLRFESDVLLRKFVAVAVAPEFQGLGIGRELMNYSMSYALRSDICSLWAEVKTENLKSRDLFRRFGFHFTAESETNTLLLKLDLF